MNLRKEVFMKVFLSVFCSLLFFWNFSFVEGEFHDVLQSPELFGESPSVFSDKVKVYLDALAKENGLREPRRLDPQILQDVKEALQSQAVCILMRHGEQEESEWVKNLTVARKKIEMMRCNENLMNSLTKDSVLEALATALALKYVLNKSGQEKVFYSSQNARAFEAGELMGKVLEQTFQKNRVWDCVNYPEELLLPINELEKKLPDGSLPWEEGIVDRILGLGSYVKIHQEMTKELQGKPFIALTHTQQINAVAEQYDQPLERLTYFGFILVDPNIHIAKTFKTGFFSPSKSGFIGSISQL